LGLLAPIALFALVVAAGSGGAATVGGLGPAAIVTALILGVSVTALIASLWIRGRVVPIVAAAERLASGDLATAVPASGGGLDGRLGRAVAQLGATLAISHAEATVDRMTGIANRPALLGMLFSEVERAARYNRPLSVGFVDIDRFKVVNDTHGHHVGDVVLRGVAEVLRANIRATDMVGRYGGEEFMLILPETTVEDAASLAEKLRLLVSGTRIRIDNSLSVDVTVSIGVAGGPGGNLRIDTTCGSTRSSAMPTRRCTRRSRWGVTRSTSSPNRATKPACRARQSRPRAGRGRRTWPTWPGWPPSRRSSQP
jgi:diguanylate cyclase (GGDEF)-like protein